MESVVSRLTGGLIAGGKVGDIPGEGIDSALVDPAAVHDWDETEPAAVQVCEIDRSTGEDAAPVSCQLSDKGREVFSSFICTVSDSGGRSSTRSGRLHSSAWSIPSSPVS